MASANERKEMNVKLGRLGLATLDDPAGFCQQAGFLVEDHDHLRRLLIRCEGAYRRDMYEALRPHLHFEPKPLDVYISEGAAIAEAKQLPTLDEDGNFRPFHQADIRTKIADIVEEALSDWHLTVTCRKCTRQETFRGARKADAVQKARDAGWGLDTTGDTPFEICPECPGPIS